MTAFAPPPADQPSTPTHPPLNPALNPPAQARSGPPHLNPSERRMKGPLLLVILTLISAVLVALAMYLARL